MRVVFDQSALNDRSGFLFLDSIFDLMDRGRHFWVVEEESALKESEWYRQNSSWRRAAIENLMKESPGPSLNKGKLHRRTLVVTQTPIRDLELTPAFALKYLSAPFRLVVENAKTDGNFLRLVFKKLAGKLADKLLNDHLSIEQAGGKGEIIKRLDQLFVDFDAPPRLMAMADSDALIPGQQDSKADQIVNHCQAKNIACHILNKRDVENYVTEPILKIWATEKNRMAVLDGFQVLTKDQRDVYDMKNGFLHKGNFRILEEQEQLYESLAESVIDALKPGFGEVGETFSLYLQQYRPRDLKQISIINGKPELEILLETIYDRI
ncbi:MAG: hypothetical protein QNK37_21215 [Acidobacteriota bacterium]|nr:hypothetical protein [Acidobacteriota bacterium]